MRIAKLIAASALVAASVGIVVSPAAAQEEAKIRVGHFSPDAPAVDIYIDGRKTFAQVRFPLMSAYTPVAAGKHTVDVRAAGSASTDPALISVAADLKAGKPYLVGALGPAAALQGALIEDDITPPAAGKAKVRVIHAAVGGPAVDVIVAGSTKLFEGVQFGKASAYSEVDATKYDLSVREAGKSTQIVGKVVSLQSGGVYTIVAIGDAAGTIGLRGFADLAPNGSSVTTPADPTSSGDSTTAGASEATPPSSDAAAGTEAAPADTTEAVAETTAPASSETTTTVADAAATEAPTSEAGSDNPDQPTGGVDSGFGAMSNTQSAASILVLGTMAGCFALLAARRRRSAR